MRKLIFVVALAFAAGCASRTQQPISVPMDQPVPSIAVPSTGLDPNTLPPAPERPPVLDTSGLQPAQVAPPSAVRPTPPQPSLAVPAVVDPTALPRFDPAPITYQGKFQIPGRDSQGNLIAYGAGASGFSEDGTQMYVACHSLAGPVANYDARGRIWVGTIPAPGGISQEIAPCTGLPDSELVKISGVAGMQSPLVGSVIQKDGRFCLGGYITYDASGQNPRKTWWCGPSLSNLSGPIEGSVRNGLVTGGTSHTGVWATLLGGDIGANAQYSSIISRSSYGSSFTTFWSKDVGTTGFPMNFLLGCPSNDPSTGAALPQCTTRFTEFTPPDLTTYNGPEKIGATFIVPNTRTLIVVLREAKGEMCYGYATTDKTLHGTIYPGPEGVHYCYSLSGNPTQKGMHGYPYVHAAVLFDLNDLVAVKNGTKKPWEVVPYATYEMPNSTDDFDVGYTGTGAFNRFTGQYFLFREAYPNGQGGADVEMWAGWPKEGSVPVPLPPTAVADSYTTAHNTALSVAAPGVLTNDDTRGLSDVSVALKSANVGTGGISLSPDGSFLFTPGTGFSGQASFVYEVSSTSVGLGNQVTSTITVAPQDPPAGLTLTAAIRPVTCRLTLTAVGKPDGTGWGVQFYRKPVADTAWTAHGGRDTASPYERVANVPAGVWEGKAIWSKSGVPDVPVPGTVLADPCQ